MIMGLCLHCKSSAVSVSGTLGICLKCIRQSPKKALEIADRVHESSRNAFGLPPHPPDDPSGTECRICANACRIPQGSIGYCGLRENINGRLTGVTALKGKLSWYHDPLPTNCVADWVCPGGTGAGYPKFACTDGPETGYNNLAVFMHACSFNCLYCQNWHFKRMTLGTTYVPGHELTDAPDRKTSCVCYFGGDPSPQLPFLIHASEKMLKQKKGAILRICWETNGSMNPSLLDRMIRLSLVSGGCIKFDIKAWDETLHRVLTGVSNRQTLKNFERAGRSIHKRPVPHLLTASTLLVPGYIDDTEISRIAGFIASINRDIPYSLLAFHPDFYLTDLPMTTAVMAEKYECAAKDAGLKNVRIGNVHLLT